VSEIFSKSFPTFNLLNGYSLDSIIPFENAENYFSYMLHPKVSAFVSSGNLPNSLSQAQRELMYWSNLFLQRKSLYWAIRSNADNHMIGTIGFNNISFMHLKGEISYDLCYNFWGKGIMRKAIEKISTFAFNVLNLVRIQASVSTNNTRSSKLLLDSGFKAEGIMSKYELLNGVHWDYILYSLTFK